MELIVMSEDIYNNRFDKYIATKKPDIDAAAKVDAHKLCNCPHSEPGKINLDIYAHLPGCHIRKKLQTGRFTINTSVTPAKFTDGCSLGIALSEQYY
jgi:hypothetical protein